MWGKTEITFILILQKSEKEKKKKLLDFVYFFV